MAVICFFISLLASVVGAICGIGGGVIIKPVLDLLQVADAGTLSFLSGCTVLSMSCYSVAINVLLKKKTVDVRESIPLAAGAAIGGILGKQFFSFLIKADQTQSNTAAIQAICLAVLTFGTLLYTLNKKRINTKKIKKTGACSLIGLLLGIISSFLGIGGGPINLVVLSYFFSMDAKTSAINSLFIIFFSQVASLLTTLLTGSTPAFSWTTLALMVAGGIGGGILGHYLYEKMDNNRVERLFIALMIVIILISIFNFLKSTFMWG